MNIHVRITIYYLKKITFKIVSNISVKRVYVKKIRLLIFFCVNLIIQRFDALFVYVYYNETGSETLIFFLLEMIELPEFKCSSD